MTKPLSIVRVNSRVSAQNWFQEFNQALPSSVSSYLKVEMQKWQESFRPRFQDRIFQKIWILKVFLEIESNEIRKLGWANARLSKDDKDPQSASLYKLPPMKTGVNKFLLIPLIMANTRQKILLAWVIKCFIFVFIFIFIFVKGWQRSLVCNFL